MSERRDITYSGYVQGVGFRATTRDIARRLAVTGYVLNLPDGRVRMVAEGAPSELDLLEQTIAERLGRNIDDVLRDVRPATDEFQAFDIRY